ncbi:MAG: right-handed parallel beta-helix repeat-containing protein [Terriglobales bacterium]
MRFRSWILSAAMLLLAASPMFAGNLAVGTCEPSYTSFPSISAAVSAAPASGSTTVYVCPGTYPEQVRITKKITLKGVAFDGANAAVITPPPGGLVTNATSTFNGGNIQAMVLVQNATATVEDLTLDATGNGAVCGGDPIGIFYQNANGTITRNSVLNVQVVGAFGCQGGLGIYLQSGPTTGSPNPSNAADATVIISYNVVENYDKNGITADGTPTGNTSNVNATISYNTVMGAGEVSDNAQNGIQMYGANGSITNNVIDGNWYAPSVCSNQGCYVATGVLVLQSYAPIINTNYISNSNVGIYVASINPGDTNNATVNSNVISANHEYTAGGSGGDGILLCANNSTATLNKINGSDESGIHVDWCGDLTPTDTATGNTINSGCAGILVDPPATGTTTPNTYYNAGTQVLTTALDVCAPALGPMKGAATSRPHPTASPARERPSKQ